MNKAMKTEPERMEGVEAMERFNALVRKVLSVPREEIMRREAEYRRLAALNPISAAPSQKPGSSSSESGYAEMRDPSVSALVGSA